MSEELVSNNDSLDASVQAVASNVSENNSAGNGDEFVTLSKAELAAQHNKYVQLGFAKGKEKAKQELGSVAQPVTPTDDVQARIDAALAAAEEKRQREIQEAQEAQQAAKAREEASRVVNEVAPKIKDAEQKYADFNDIVGPAGFADRNFDMVAIANQVDNAGDILYDLAKNPEKIRVLRDLAETPALLKRKLKSMSESLKNATSAQEIVKPIDNDEPSYIVSGEKSSWAERKKQYRT